MAPKVNKLVIFVMLEVAADAVELIAKLESVADVSTNRRTSEVSCLLESAFHHVIFEIAFKHSPVVAVYNDP